MEVSTTLYVAIAINFIVGGLSETAIKTQQTRSSNLKQFRDGHILIGGLMLVHDHHCKQIKDLGIQGIETMNMIIDQINANDTILPNITLGTIMVDTCKQDTHALHRVVAEILPYVSDLSAKSCSVNRTSESSKPLFAGVVGAASSSVSIQVTKLLQVFAIPQVSYYSTNPDLSDKEKFGYFFRTVPPDNHQARAIIDFIKSEGWDFISVVYEDTFYGFRGFTEVEKAAGIQDICIAEKLPLRLDAKSSDYEQIVRKLMTQSKARVVVLFTYAVDASRIISMAESIPEASGHFQWVGTDAWTRQIPTDADYSYEAGLEGAVGFVPKADGDIAGFHDYFTSLTLAKHYENPQRNPWFAEYISVRKNCSLEGDLQSGRRTCDRDERIEPATFQHLLPVQYVADAVLSIVYALDQFHRDVCGGAPGICPRMRGMSGTNMVAAGVFENLKNVTFIGSNGKPFTFDQNYDAPGIYDVYNYDIGSHSEKGKWDKKWIFAGVYDSDHFDWKESLVRKAGMNGSSCSEPCQSNEEMRISETMVCCWTCHSCKKNQYVLNKTSCEACATGQKPNLNGDGCVDIVIQQMTFDSPYSISSIAIGAVGGVLAIFVLVLFVINRDTAIVKASGKELCFFVLFGVILTFTNSLAITAPASVVSCAVSRVILSLGPTCMYAGLLAKTLRVVIIFRSKILSPQVKLFLRPASQIGVACSMVMIQVFVVTIWCSSNPPDASAIFTDYDNAFLACKHLMDLRILIGLVYPFLLILVCTILATMNRRVPTGFNEAQLIGFTMYTTCVIWLAFLPIFATNENKHAQKITTTSVCLSLSAYTVLLCLFFPRCFKMLFHPEKNTAQSVMSTNHSSTINTQQQNKV